ncbi:response regulator [Geomesophilobacter sediminis]|uniref:Response regulator n=1 Tax=Geomesophilobacter sediminis TaxID=2798584 RepID=A0A8J7M1E3_9BACT|nr:response regulator [Geomesophilobacter sediminis]MBJ6726678.1 response regulator [Geomesophilobacter sediminis]
MAKRCLIVDDDAMSCEMMHRMLRGYFQCTAVMSGQHAWELIDLNYQAGTPYELICCDLHMPGLDGRTLIGKLRALEASGENANEKKTKVFVVSASNSANDIVDTFMSGAADGYILKPCRAPQLQRLLAENGFDPEPNPPNAPLSVFA